MKVRKVNIDAPSRNNCSRLKAENIKYHECVFVFVLVIWHENRISFSPYFIVICGLSDCTMIYHII
jgi:hypothetical protein